MKERVAEFRRAGIPASLNSGCIEVLVDEPQGWLLVHIRGWDADPQVPVMYFSVGKDEAFYTTTEQVMQVLPLINLQNISQTVHPTLGTRVWFVHPCRTREWLEAMAADSDSGLGPQVWLQWYRGMLSTQLGLSA